MALNLNRIAVVYGGRSAEREISLLSGQAVAESLDKQGFKVVKIDLLHADIREILTEAFDKVFIMLHGKGGEDGVLQGFLSQANIPYTGSDVKSCALTIDKLKTKIIWDAVGIPTPRYKVIRNTVDIELASKELQMPVVVKPNSEGSTLGISIVRDAQEMHVAYEKARKYEELILIEQFIAGIELTATILNGESLPLVRIEAPGGNYDYEAKYFSNKTKYYCPSGLRNDLEENIKNLCLRAFKELGCEGWGRVDLMLDKENKPYLLEINTVPGMTNHSLVPMAAKAAGLNFDELVLRILRGW